MADNCTPVDELLAARDTVVAEHTVKKFGNCTALDDINFSVHSGELFGFIGPDGAGKSTLLRLLAGVMQPTSGKLEILGRQPREQQILDTSAKHMG